MAENTVEEKSGRRRKRRGEVEAEIEEDEVEERGLTESKGRATPGRRIQGESEGGNFITRFFRGTVEYFGGVRDELRKVTWPTREEMRRLTVIVLLVTIAASITLGLISFAFTELFILGFDNEIVFIIMFAVIIAGFFIYNRLNARSNRIKPY